MTTKLLLIFVLCLISVNIYSKQRHNYSIDKATNMCLDLMNLTIENQQDIPWAKLSCEIPVIYKWWTKKTHVNKDCSAQIINIREGGRVVKTVFTNFFSYEEPKAITNSGEFSKDDPEQMVEVGVYELSTDRNCHNDPVDGYCDPNNFDDSPAIIYPPIDKTQFANKSLECLKKILER